MNATIAEGIVSAGEMLKEKSKVPLCATDQSSLEQNTNPGCAILTCAKWCPLDNCTILVLGELVHHTYFPLRAIFTKQFYNQLKLDNSLFQHNRMSIWSSIVRLGWVSPYS